MERPVSIVWFERCYLAGVAVDAIAVWQLFKPDTKLWFGESRV